MKGSKKIYFILFSFITILFSCQLYFSNRLTVEGRELEQTQKEINSLEEENNYLKNQIAEAGCLSNLTQKAAEKGFVKDFKLVNLTSQVPIAANPR